MGCTLNSSFRISHPTAHWRLGMIYENKGNVKQARAEYETSLRLDPDYKAAKDALKHLRKKQSCSQVPGPETRS